MTQLSAWTTTVCLAVVAAAIVEMLTPESKLGKSVHMLLCLFLLCAMFLPFAGGIHIEIPKPERSSAQKNVDALSLEEEIKRQSLVNMEAKVAELTRQKLAENGYDAKKITVEMDTLSGGRIEIKQTTVWMDQKWLTHEGRVMDILKKELGLAAAIVYG